MQNIAVHGFLGHGSNWDQVLDSTWAKPNLFDEDCPIPLTSFAAACKALAELCNGGSAVGYSLGGRLLLVALQFYPDAFEKIQVIGAHPGELDTKSAKERMQWNLKWAQRIQQDPWEEWLKDWNALEVFDGCPSLKIVETDFRKDRLVQALKNLSLVNQSCSLDKLKLLQDKITWVVGEKDKKYCDLYKNLQDQGIVKQLKIIPGKGHRFFSDILG